MCSPKVTEFRCLRGLPFQNAQPEIQNVQPVKLPEQLIQNAQPEQLHSKQEKLYSKPVIQNAQPVESDLERRRI